MIWIIARTRFALTAGFLLPILFGAPSSAQAGKSLALGLGLESGYDDNILQYSSSQIRLFESGTKPTHYSIQSTDDGVFQPKASLTFESERPDHHSSTLRVRLTGSFHSKNGTADSRTATLSYREEFGSRHSLTVSAYRLPHFYLRQLFDEDVVNPFPGMTKYRRAEFGLTILSATWRERLTRRSRLVFDYGYERRGYNADFLERTSNTHQGGLGYEWTSAKGGRGFGFSGAYRSSRAKADDADGTLNDDQDVSYRGAVLGADGKVSLARGGFGRLTGEASYEYRTRDYTSDRPNDLSHNGRNDHLHNVELGLRLTLPKRFAIRGIYQYEENDASFSSPVVPTTDPASYIRRQVGVEIDWSSVLWRRS